MGNQCCCLAKSPSCSSFKAKIGFTPDHLAHNLCSSRGQVSLMVYSDWLTLGLELVTGTGTGKLACMILCRTFHTTPELGPVSGLGNSRMGFKPNFQDLKLSLVISCSWFLTTFTIFNTSSALKMVPTCRKIKTFRHKNVKGKKSISCSCST